MSEENVEIVRQMYDAWAKGDFGAGESLYDPYVVYLGQRGERGDPDPGPHYGADAVRGYMRRVLESWESFRIAATDFREAGDSVIVRVHRAGVGKGSHIEVEDEAFHVWTLRGGRVIRLDVFAEKHDALEAAGLRE
jgi:ketosteroid isomerase-like protein